MTHKILTSGDPRVQSADSRLSPLTVSQPTHRYEQIVDDRHAHTSHSKFTTHQVPGDTGYVPKSANYLGHTYAKVVEHAVGDHQLEQEALMQKTEHILTTTQAVRPMAARNISKVRMQ